MKHIKSILAAGTLLATGLAGTAAQAQERYIGEVFTVGFNFCPRGTAEAAGQLLAISSNTALFSLLGTTYGGDGRTSFALPDLRGRMAIGSGSGPGLSNFRMGERGGSETVTTIVYQLPSHSHTIRAETVPVEKSDPAVGTDVVNVVKAPGGGVSSTSTVLQADPAGGNQSHSIMQPFLAMKNCIVVQGIYPSRS